MDCVRRGDEPVSQVTSVVVWLGMAVLAAGGAFAGGSTSRSGASVPSTEDFDGDGRSDLVIGIYGETVSSRPFEGAITVIRGSRGGLTDAGSQLWHQNSPGIAGQRDADQYYAAALASRTPDWIFADGFESGDLARWSSATW